MLRLTRADVWRYRLHVSHLTERLPAGDFAVAARCAVQDSAPRSGLISLHARVDACPPSGWEHPSLVQTYSPRAAVHLLPDADFGIFTIGRLPADPVARKAIDAAADEICAVLNDGATRTWELPPHLPGQVRWACASGRIEIRWDARSLRLRTRPRPRVTYRDASLALARRHLHHFGPTDPEGFARWSGLAPADARAVWSRLSAELVEVLVDDVPAWFSGADIDTVRHAPAMRGVRFLPAEELRLLGILRPPRYDTFHPHGLLVDGRLIGAWGRRGGDIHLLPDRALDNRTRESIEAEATAIPIPGAVARVRITPDVA